MVAVGGGRQEYEYEWVRSSAPPVCSSVGSVLIRRSVRLSAMAGRLARASWAGRAGRLCAAPGRSPTNAAASCSIARGRLEVSRGTQRRVIVLPP